MKTNNSNAITILDGLLNEGRYSVQLMNRKGEVIDTIRSIPTLARAKRVERGTLLESPIGYETRIVRA